MAPTDIFPTLGRNDVFVMPTRDGSDTLFSRAFNATYHSMYGAVGESRHVFVQFGLDSLKERNEIHILELGFGTGLNAFLAYLFSIKHNLPVYYTGIEAFPIDLDVARQLNYPQYLAYAEEQEVFERMHAESHFTTDHFHFQKVSDIREIEDTSRFDCIFFDAFAPGVQPELWSQDMLSELFRLTTPGGCLVTYCAQGEVRRRLVTAGYEVQRLQGPPGKREMLRAVRKSI